MLLIITSVIISCLETMEYFSQLQSTQHQVIHILEIICVIWFTAEIITRFIVCPSKRKFLKQIMNWLDFAAITPFYLQLFLTNTEMNSIVALRIIRLIRVFRVFKLSRHSYSLQILGHTLRSSLSELFLLGFFLSIGVVVFSTLMFYAEQESDKNEFSSIPAGFWWAVVTMTTLGYGDIVPDTLPGKLVGTACAICGVLTIALPIPVIVSNFSLYYSHAKAKQKASQRKRPLVIGAANALKVIDPFVGSRTNLRLSAFSENASYRSPSARRWPKIALDMAGSSFESSEPPMSPTRRRLSKQPDKLWQLNSPDIGRNSENCRKQSTASKITDESPTSRKNSEDCRNSMKFENRTSTSSDTAEESCQDLFKTTGPNEAKKCHGAYDNEAIERNSETENTPRNDQSSFQFDEDAAVSSNDNRLPYGEQYNQYHNALPKIEIICNSSAASQISGSISDGVDKLPEEEHTERSRRKFSKKKTKKKLTRSRTSVEKATSAPSLPVATEGFLGKNLPGRMGRRGSVFVVGFLGKRWQAKAARGRKNRMRDKPKPDDIELLPVQNKSLHDFLQVSPSASSRVSSPNSEMSRRTSTTGLTTPNSSINSRSPVFHFPLPVHQSITDSNFFRRSSCPVMRTLNFPENSCNKTGLNLAHNDCINLTEDKGPAKSSESKKVNQRMGSSQEERTKSTVFGKDALDTDETKPDTRNYRVNIKRNELDTTQNGVEKNYDDAGTLQYEKEKESTVIENSISRVKRPEVDTSCYELNKELPEYEAAKSDSNYIIKTNRKSKQDKSATKQRSLSSTQSDSSLKAEFDGTVRRSSSPLTRQKAFMSFQEQGVTQQKDSDDEMQALSIKKGLAIDHRLEQAPEQTYHERTENSQNNEDLLKNGHSSITLMEIGKSQPSSSTLSTIDKKEKDELKTIVKNDKQTEVVDTVNAISEVAPFWTESSPLNNIDVNDQKTRGESKTRRDRNKRTRNYEKSKNKTEPVQRKQSAKTNDDHREDTSKGNTKPHDKTENSSDLRFSDSQVESTADKNHSENTLTSENNNTSVGSKDLYMKDLTNGSTPENNRRKNEQSNSIALKTGKNPGNQGLTDEQNEGNEMEDDFCSTMDGIPPNEFSLIIDSDVHIPHNDMNDNPRYINNNRVQNGKGYGLNKKPDTIPNNNRKCTNVAMQESIDLSEYKNQTINSVNMKKNQENKSENKNLWRKSADSEHPSFHSTNLSHTGRQDQLLTTSVIDKTSGVQSTSSEHTNAMSSGMQRKVEAQDSGVYCSDYRSSIDSVSSLTEKNGDRGILKTISEVEHDYDYRHSMLLFQPFVSQHYEKSKSYVLEIRDETPV